MANSIEKPVSPLLIGSLVPLALACLLACSMSAHATDVTIQPAAGSGFVVKDASGANERLRVQESGAVSLPAVPAAPVQPQGLCMSASGQLGPCSGGTGGGSYTAATGLALTGTTFSVAPTYRLPQGCSPSSIAQWNGTVWACGTAGGGALPSGTSNQTLRYNASNALEANNMLQAFSDGGLVASGVNGTAGNIPATGPGIRMMWYPGKVAFRAGVADGAEWDDVNIGPLSVAMGGSTTARGFASVAIGRDTTALGDYSFAIGDRTTANKDSSTALGYNTLADDKYSTAMGIATRASGESSTAMGELTVASGASSTAMGNNTQAVGKYATAMGYRTTADGDNSTAMGSNVSTASHAGSFIYGDAAHTGTVTNTNTNQFLVLAYGGIEFDTGEDPITHAITHGATLAPGSGTWTSFSDRSAKTAVQPVDAREVLKNVVAMPLNTWQYKTQDAKYRHLGPMAQDFYAAFHLGESDKGIDTVDADGVALAAIQGLNAELIERDRMIATLSSQMDTLAKSKDAEIAALRGELSAQTRRVAALELLAEDVASLKKQLAMSRQSSLAPGTVALARP